MRKGFSLIEMLVVIGIIAVLMGTAVGGYSFATKRAQAARGRELVANTATALNLLFQKDGKWPGALLNEAGSGAGRLTARAAACLAVKKYMSLTYTRTEKDGESYYTLSGLDRCGIVTPWATAASRSPKRRTDHRTSFAPARQAYAAKSAASGERAPTRQRSRISSSRLSPVA